MIQKTTKILLLLLASCTLNVAVFSQTNIAISSPNGGEIFSPGEIENKKFISESYIMMVLIRVIILFFVLPNSIFREKDFTFCLRRRFQCGEYHTVFQKQRYYKCSRYFY